MKDILDGEYIGSFTPKEVISQFLYRIGIHETYAGLVLDDEATWISYGSYEYHMWAINGYEWGIKHIQESNPVVYKCSLGEAFTTIFKSLFGRK